MNSFNFSDKTVIITGGGTGIGYEIAKSFLNSGSNVAIIGRRNDVLDGSCVQIKKEIPGSDEKIIAISCDMSDELSVGNMFRTIHSTYQYIDILINNCGTWTLDMISELENDEIDKQYNNILKSTILGTKYAAKYMNKGGVIINIGSFAGILSMKNASLYSSFKSAINTFTKSSAQELGDNNIRVNCVVPGVIRTPMTSQYIDDNYNKIIKPISLGRVGSCEEVANGVLFMCSDLASYITGAILEITGGKYTTQL